MEFPDIGRYPYFSVDTETTGLKYPVDRVFGVSIATPDNKTYYWDVRQSRVLEWLADASKHYAGTIINHHIKFDWLMLLASGCELPLSQLDCTMVRACLINEHLQDYSLDELSLIYLGERKASIYDKLAEIFGGLPTRKVQMPNLQYAPTEVVAPYAKTDALLALKLWEWQQAEIIYQDLERIVAFERSVIPSICRANARGIRVDLNAAERAMEGLTPIVDEKQAELNAMAGWDVNVNSSPQIKKLFNPQKQDGVGWFVGKDIVGTTDSGGPSLKADFLREISHPAAALILEIRSLLKTRGTFLAKHIIEHAVDGRVYPTINQTKGEDGGTGTGRLSYTDPAMQQIPSRNKRVAAIVKPCFLPDEGEVWVDLDQASFEVRVFAHLANDKVIIQRYKDNPTLDFHGAVATLTGLVRDAEYSGQPNSKQLNLSMIFNQGAGATAKKMGMPWEWDTFENNQGQKIRYMKAGDEAQDVIDRYHRMLPGVRKLANGCKSKAIERGYIKTEHGRHLRFPGRYKVYKASGLLIQATSADINKEMWKLIDEAGIKLLLNTHDSYGLSMPPDVEAETVAKQLQDAMQSIIPWLRVPLVLELNGVGNNWWEALQ